MRFLEGENPASSIDPALGFELSPSASQSLIVDIQILGISIFINAALLQSRVTQRGSSLEAFQKLRQNTCGWTEHLSTFRNSRFQKENLCSAPPTILVVHRIASEHVMNESGSSTLPFPSVTGMFSWRVYVAV